MKQIIELAKKEDLIRWCFEFIDSFALTHLYYHPYQALTPTAKAAFKAEFN